MTAVNTAIPGMEREKFTAHGRIFSRPSVVLASPVLHVLFPLGAYLCILQSVRRPAAVWDVTYALLQKVGTCSEKCCVHLQG